MTDNLPSIAFKFNPLTTRVIYWQDTQVRVYPSGVKGLSYSCLQQPKSPHNLGDISLIKAIFKKIFDGELFIRTLSTTFLQILSKLVLHLKIIFKSMTSPDDTDLRYAAERILSHESWAEVVAWHKDDMGENKILHKRIWKYRDNKTCVSISISQWQYWYFNISFSNLKNTMLLICNYMLYYNWYFFMLSNFRAPHDSAKITSFK